MSGDLIKLPRKFFDAYCDQACAPFRSPVPLRETARNVWFSPHDRGLDGLRVCAEQVEDRSTGSPRGNALLSAARATLRAFVAAEADAHERANIDCCPSDMLHSYVAIGERRIARGVLSDAWARSVGYARQVLAEREAEGAE